MKQEGFDIHTKTGLLPKNHGVSSVDGNKTFVVGSKLGVVNPGQRAALLDGRKRTMADGRSIQTIGKRKYIDPPASALNGSVGSRDGHLTPQQRAEQRRKEDAKLKRLLIREGGKSLGAKYLERNGKAPVQTRRDNAASTSGARGDSSGERSDTGDERAARDDESVKKKRVFDVEAIRKIGFDPTSRNAEETSAAEKNKKVRRHSSPTAICGHLLAHETWPS